MGKKFYQKEIKKIVNQIVKKYKPEKIYLFGSFACGKPTKDSDVDLLVIKNTQKKKVERIKEVLMKVKSSLPLEPLVYSPREFQERLILGDFFIKEVTEKGELVYEK